MRMPTREHKLAPRGQKCIMMGIAHNHPSGTVKVRNVRTGQLVHRQDVSWHPKSPENEGGVASVWSRGEEDYEEDTSPRTRGTTGAP